MCVCVWKMLARRGVRGSKNRKRQWMRRVVLRTTFSLDEITRGVQGDLVICGHYNEVKAVVSYQYVSNYSFTHVVLRHNGVSTTSYDGECCRKVLVDVLRVVKETSKGRLYLLKEDYLRRFAAFVEDKLRS